MLSWMKRQQPSSRDESHLSIPSTLAQLYKAKLYPLEEYTRFQEFHSPLLDDAHFTSRPMVLLIGQYSTGKTTFLRYLVEKDFPGMRIGPEPTTDGFMVLEHNEIDSLIPGNALVVDPSKPYAGLSKFGVSFLNRFQGAGVNSEVLKHVSLVDTPGILSGSKQLTRGYDFIGVLEWFAERVDRIIILFDAHKLDISNELKWSIQALKGNQEKIRIVLNKADQVDTQQLMRVYGALLWSLAKVFDTPEVVRVYTGSFWSNSLQCQDNRKLFELEKADLFSDLQTLPRSYAVRLLNDLVKRARLALVHAYIIQAVKSEIGVFSGSGAKKKIIEKLPEIYNQIHKTHSISLGDFPELDHMKKCLSERDIGKLPKFRKEMVDTVKFLLTRDIPPLMARINQEEFKNDNTKVIRGGVFENESSPFSENFDEGVSRGQGEEGWIVDEERGKWTAKFEEAQPNANGKIEGRRAKPIFVASKLPNSTLGKIWQLADIDKDGALDYEEFALMMYLIEKVALPKHALPEKLPQHLIPPSKRTIRLNKAHLQDNEASGSATTSAASSVENLKFHTDQ